MSQEEQPGEGPTSSSAVVHEHAGPTTGAAAPTVADEVSGTGEPRVEGHDTPTGTIEADAGQSFTPEQHKQMQEAAEALKAEGNRLYGEGKLDEAVEKYHEALKTAPEGAPQRAIYLANLAACSLKQRQWGEAAEYCTSALDVDPGYLKAYMRRSEAFENVDELEHALNDAKKVLELDASNAWGVAAKTRLEPKVHARHEKLKEETLGKLKELGNTILGKFGLSLDNFKAEKDPTTGSYSIKMG